MEEGLETGPDGGRNSPKTGPQLDEANIIVGKSRWQQPEREKQRPQQRRLFSIIETHFYHHMNSQKHSKAGTVRAKNPQNPQNN